MRVSAEQPWCWEILLPLFYQQVYKSILHLKTNCLFALNTFIQVFANYYTYLILSILTLQFFRNSIDWFSIFIVQQKLASCHASIKALCSVHIPKSCNNWGGGGEREKIKTKRPQFNTPAIKVAHIRNCPFCHLNNKNLINCSFRILSLKQILEILREDKKNWVKVLRRVKESASH